MNTQERGVAVLSMAEIVAKSPDPVAAIRSLGASIARSQMLGPTDRQEIGEVVVLICLNTGMTLSDLFRTHQISFGRLEKRIDAAVAEFRAKGGRIEWIEDGGDGQKARAKFILGDESIEAGCNVAEAAKAGWTKNKKWESEPTTMLRARVKKRGILALCPEIFFGEETEDRDMKPLTVSPEQMAASAASAAAKPPAPAPSRPAPAPAPTPAPAPAPAPAAPASAAASGQKLSDEIQGKLVEIIGVERIAIATEWAVSVNWLAAGQTLEDLSEKNAKYIVANAPKFLTKLAEFEAKKGGVK